MSRSKKCIDSLKSQLVQMGITAPESMASDFTALTDDALEYVSGGTTTFREFSSFPQSMSDGSTRFGEVWTTTVHNKL